MNLMSRKAARKVGIASGAFLLAISLAALVVPNAVVHTVAMRLYPPHVWWLCIICGIGIIGVMVIPWYRFTTKSAEK